MELVLIKPESKEWIYMWNWLSVHPMNKDLSDPSEALWEGESWQYMGSFRQNERLIHEFRHRCHPQTNGVKSLKVEASKDMNEDDVEKNFKL